MAIQDQQHDQFKQLMIGLLKGTISDDILAKRLNTPEQVDAFIQSMKYELDEMMMKAFIIKADLVGWQSGRGIVEKQKAWRESHKGMTLEESLDIALADAMKVGINGKGTAQISEDAMNQIAEDSGQNIKFVKARALGVISKAGSTSLKEQKPADKKL